MLLHKDNYLTVSIGEAVKAEQRLSVFILILRHKKSLMYWNYIRLIFKAFTPFY